MSRCYSCGRENVDTQMIELEGTTHWVCPLCFVKIKKNQRQIEQVGRPNTYKKIDTARDELVDVLDKTIDVIFDKIRHLEELDESRESSNKALKKVKASNDERKKEIAELSKELQSLKSRIESLESKLLKVKWD